MSRTPASNPRQRPIRCLVLCLYAVIMFAAAVPAQAQEGWGQRYSGPVNGVDSANGPATDSNGKVHVTEQPSGSGTGKLDSYSSEAYDFDFGPRNGPAGTLVTIAGPFLESMQSVYFNGVAASFVVNSPTQITATVPAGASTGPIHIVTPYGTAVSPADFTVLLPAVASFSPASGPAGTIVTINGTNFTGASSVSFGDVAVTSFTVVSSTQIEAIVPAGNATGKISITAPGGTVVTERKFQAISLLSFTPATGRAGTMVTITGTGLSGTTAVKFNETTATSLTFVSTMEIRAIVPAGTISGKISIVTPAGVVVSGTNFTFIPTPTTDWSAVRPAERIINRALPSFGNGTSADFTAEVVDPVRAPMARGSQRVIERILGHTGSNSGAYGVFTGRYEVDAAGFYGLR